MATINETKNTEALKLTFEKSDFNGELEYKLISTNKLVKQICKTFGAMTDDFVGARFVRVDRVPQIASEFLNARLNDIDHFIDAKASNEEKASLFQVSNIIRNYINAEENNKLKPNGALSYVCLYFEDRREGEGKVKFVKPKDKIMKESSTDKMSGWINAWNSRNDYKYLAITADAKKCLEGFVPRRNPMNNKEAYNSKQGILWDNLYDVRTINDLYNMGYYQKQYNVVMVPIDINKFFSMIHGKTVEGSNQKYEYEFNFVVPKAPSVFAEQVRTNNYMLNVVQINGERVQKVANENGVTTNTNKLGFLVNA